MTARELTRAHLEALIVARAIVAPDPAAILDKLDRTVASTAAVALLEQLVDPDVDDVRTTTQAQRALAERVEAVTLREMIDWPVQTLVGLLNGLAPRPVAEPAWQRDLATGLDQENAA